MRRFFIVILIAGIAVIAMSAFRYLGRPGAGDLAPSFTLSSLDARQVSLDDFRGRPVIVHFFATWCGWCRRGFPSLARLHGAMKGDDLVILAISEDGEGGGEAVRSFLKYMPVEFPVLLDGEGDVADAYMSFGVPDTFAIDRAGIIRWRRQGFVDWDDPGVRAVVHGLMGG